ncbi:MAG TPA: AmmeMemoRadiSam system protein B [Vicinamibacterales bacterium]|nr:AmmeMemoRadiSam system protein B [Vicinamibacterales bacterium]HOQ59223.1 AmmeMemoRadiSam system protein B [Vicinamibacterales bacterium]HPK70726.1 AmmeMemoRadiSam system protein B [Vicinamibacterales bacterium]
MAPQPVRRPAAVAGTWYPGQPARLAAEIERYTEAVSARISGDIVGLVAPHAGLAYSGPVAAHAYRQLDGRAYDVVVLVGPSHHVGFEGVAIAPRGVFETPLGDLPISEADADAIMAASPIVQDLPAAHRREHSVEMQLPFIQRMLPGVPIVPLVMGHQSRSTVAALGDGLAAALAHRRPLLVASSDLSHYQDSRRAAQLDQVIVTAVERFDPEAVERALARNPEHACGGGPMVAVMRAARALGAADARVLCYADSGAVSGDTSAVVGYMAAVLGTFRAAA